MRLRVTTPTAIVEDADGIAHLRAEDETGAFGILPGHAPFLTTLPISVVTWRTADAAPRHLAVRGGVLTVGPGTPEAPGTVIEIATRQAIREDDLAALERKVREVFLRDVEDEDRARTTARQLHLAAMRQIQRVIDASRPQGTASTFGAEEDVG